MMFFGEPYFMKNKEWYYTDEKDKKRPIKLTNKAPKKAKESYEKYCQMLDEVSKPYVDENGIEWRS